MELADFDNHPIEGIARMGNKKFIVPLITEIEEGFWQGGCPRTEAPKDIEFIVNLYPWEPYALHDHQIYLQVKLYDAGDIPDERILHHLAGYINSCRDKGKTLVHCQAGLNRSALVAGLSLIKRGMKPADAIAMMREKRCDAVLCNKFFEDWLLSQ